MENYIENIFDDTMVNSMEGMVRIFKEKNKTPEQIAESIKDLNEISRNGIYVCALSNGDKKTADKIEKANQILKESRINKFKEAVLNGKEQEFLSNMSCVDKASLKVDMGLFRIGIPSEKPLTAEEQRYSDIIEKSIYEDIEKEALSQGFSSVEEWREYNAKMASALELDYERIQRR